MPRLFFAIETPPKFKEELTSLQARIVDQFRTLDPVPNFKLENLHNSHCTLRFLGNTQEAMIPALTHHVRQAIRVAAVPAFSFTIGSCNVFAHRNRARVVWVGLMPEEPFRMLQEAIDQGLRTANVSIETEHALRPHLTLLRFREPYSIPSDLIFPATTSSRLSAVASEVLLIESKTLPEGPIHTVRERFRLV